MSSDSPHNGDLTSKQLSADCMSSVLTKYWR